MDSGLLTPKQVAGHLNVSTATVYRLTKTGHLQAQKIGQQYRYTTTAVAAYVETTTVVPKAREKAPDWRTALLSVEVA